MKKGRKFLDKFMWFVIWILIYSVLYITLNFLLKEMFGNMNFYNIKIVYFLILGLFFSIFSRIIYSLINRMRIRMGVDIIFWAFGYALSILIGEFFIYLILEKLGFQLLTNIFVEAIFIGIILELLVKLFKQMDFGSQSHFSRHRGFNFRDLRWLVILAFLIFSYFYYKKNSFTGFVWINFFELPVSSFMFWGAVIVISYIIYAIADNL